jgi:hypothetical protein
VLWELPNTWTLSRNCFITDLLTIWEIEKRTSVTQADGRRVGTLTGKVSAIAKSTGCRAEFEFKPFLDGAKSGTVTWVRAFGTFTWLTLLLTALEFSSCHSGCLTTTRLRGEWKDMKKWRIIAIHQTTRDRNVGTRKNSSA